MNAELQATNEEIQTLNQVTQERGNDLGRLNGILESVFTSLRGGVVLLDRELRVLRWNRKAEALWGPRTEEAQSKNFLNLDIGLPVEQLKGPIRACLASDDQKEFTEIMLDATNRRGKPIRVKVTCTQLAHPDRGPTGHHTADGRGQWQEIRTGLTTRKNNEP